MREDGTTKSSSPWRRFPRWASAQSLSKTYLQVHINSSVLTLGGCSTLQDTTLRHTVTHHLNSQRRAQAGGMGKSEQLGPAHPRYDVGDCARSREPLVLVPRQVYDLTALISDSMPTSFDTPMFWPESDQQYLAGTDIERKFADRLS